MGNQIVSWIYSLLICACITSLMMALLPTDGKHIVFETGCSCVMLLTLLSPLFDFTGIELEDLFSSYMMEASMDDFDILAQSMMQQFIETECEEYIIEQAKTYGIDVLEVKVDTEQTVDGEYIPSGLYIKSYTTVTDEFKEHISNTMGISLENQRVQTNENDVE